MDITLNGQLLTIDEPCNLHNLLLQNNIAERKGIAVAVNEQVIPKAHWPNTIINTSDSIIVIQATQGG